MWAPTPIPTCWPSTSSSTRRRSRPGDPRRPSAVLIIASTLEPSRPIPFLSFFLSARRDRAELAAARPPGSSSPPRSNPSRPELRNLAPTLLHLSSTPAVPKPGRNRAPAVARHRRFPWTPPSPSSPHLRSSPPKIKPLVSSTATSSPSPTPSPAESRAPAAAAPPRRRVRAAPTARTPRGYSTPARAPPPCAPPPLGLPDARPASLFRRLALPRTERRRRRRAVAPAACAAAARAPLHPYPRAPRTPGALASVPPSHAAGKPPPAGARAAAGRLPLAARRPAGRPCGQSRGRGSGPGLPCMWGPAVSRPPFLMFYLLSFG